MTLPNCLLSLDAEATVPAQEPGVLTNIPGPRRPTGGGRRSAGPDRRPIPRARQNVAHSKLEVAKKQATDDIDVRYATAAADVAKAGYESGAWPPTQNPRAPFPRWKCGSMAQVEREMTLSIEKAKKEMDVAHCRRQVAKAELEAANVNIEHRRIIAPLDAVVVELSRHEGEWVQAGDPVMRLVPLDLLRVEGFLRAKEHSEFRGPRAGRCRSIVTLPHGQPKRSPARSSTSSRSSRAASSWSGPRCRTARKTAIWVLGPGLSAEMTIELK